MEVYCKVCQCTVTPLSGGVAGAAESERHYTPSELPDFKVDWLYSTVIIKSPNAEIYFGRMMFYSSSRVQSLQWGTLKLFWRLVIAQHLTKTLGVSFVPLTAFMCLYRSNLYKHLSTFWTGLQLEMRLQWGLPTAFLTPVPLVPSHNMTQRVMCSCRSRCCSAWREFWAVSLNSICVKLWHTSERAQSIVYHAGSCRNAHRENEDKGDRDREILTVCQNRRKLSNIIIHTA